MDQGTDATKHIKFQRGVYQAVLHTGGWIYVLISRFSFKKYKPKSKTFLLVGNHNMALDPFQAVITTRRHIRFVSNDAILKSFWGPALSFFVGPISRKRGASTDETVEVILENLRSGISVAMYPESERSWDGRTQVISKKTAVLAKESGAGLVTMQTNGSYLRTPHWARAKRNGPTFGRVMHEYTADDLEKMSVDEIYEAICEDLYVDAFEFNRIHMKKYRGRNLAENVELLCYICPKCEAIGQMSSEGDYVKCEACGYTLKYNVYGFFEGEEVIYDNTALWSSWQKSWLKENAGRLKKQTEKPILSNKGVNISVKDEDGNMNDLLKDAFSYFYGDRIEIVKDGRVCFSFKLEDISKLGAFGRRMLMFTCSGKYYKLWCEKEFISEYQYYGLWRVLTDREYY